MRLEREICARIVCELGYRVYRGFSFHWHSKRTPDSSISKDGKIHRWSDGWHGDIIDFITETKHLNFLEAKRLLDRFGNIEITNSFPSLNSNKKESRPIDIRYLDQFHMARYENFEKFSYLLKRLLPSVTPFYRQKELAIRYKIGYIKQSNRLLIPIFDINGEWITSAKYNPYPNKKSPKITFTKERQKIPFNLKDMLFYKQNPLEWILILEGHKDVLNAVGNGYRAITPGGAGDRFRDEDISLFEGLKVCIVGDYDEAGFRFNKNIERQLQGVAKIVKAIDWESIASLKKIGLKKGFDFTDYLLASQARR